MIESKIIARLKAKMDPAVGARYIKGTVEFAAAMKDGVKICPAMFVVLSTPSYEENEFGTQIVSQRCTEEFGVVSVVKSVRSISGEDSIDLLQAVRAPLFAALHGYVPTPDCDPIEARRGRVLDFKDGALWWLDLFVTRYEIRTGVSNE